jgi:PAS domain-containing protein
MSPKIESLLGYSPEELKRIGFSNIVGDDIFSFYREKNRVEEKVSSVEEVQKKRERGFLGNRQWEGFYKVRRTDGRYVWVIDRSTITKFRNSIEDNIICLSGGILLETTELMDTRSVAPG